MFVPLSAEERTERVSSAVLFSLALKVPPVI